MMNCFSRVLAAGMVCLLAVMGAVSSTVAHERYDATPRTAVISAFAPELVLLKSLPQ